MLISMTGYGKGSYEYGDLIAHVTVRSVNHRALDLKMKSNLSLPALESKIIQWLRQHIGRGHLDLSIEVLDQSPASHHWIDVHKALALKRELLQLQQQLNLPGALQFKHIIGHPAIWEVQAPRLTEDQAWDLIQPALEQAMQKLYLHRKKEGESLQRALVHLIWKFQDTLRDIQAKAPQRIEDYRVLLREKIDKLSRGYRDFDPKRIALEVALFADRIDITEEIDRAFSHLKTIHQLLNQEQSPTERRGKRLDFLFQELYREANTMASKARHAEIAQCAVDLKSWVESMREQVANIQ